MSRLFDELKEGDVYSNVSFEESIWYHIKQACDQDGIAYAHHYNRMVNEAYQEDERLKELRREKAKINAEILKIEQKLNERTN